MHACEPHSKIDLKHTHTHTHTHKRLEFLVWQQVKALKQSAGMIETSTECIC